MSKTRSIVIIAATAWVVTGTIPLHAQAQIVADGPGITVNLNGAQLMHRSSVPYPADALTKGVTGTVIVQARLDPDGDVIDAAVLSGPDELRKGPQQSVLSWHFDKTEGGTTRVVNIDFAQTANAARPNVVKSPDPLPERTVTQIQVSSAPMQPPAPRSGTIDQIDVTGLSDSAAQQLLDGLPVHAGDPLTTDALARAADAAHQFDPHLMVGIGTEPSGVNVMSIRSRQPFVPANGPEPDTLLAGSFRIVRNAQPVNLINVKKPVYPPLAKMARQQGTVKLEATIAKDGAMKDPKAVSGPPLLIPAAMDAVKQWICQPWVMNGERVEVTTTIDIIFTLAEEP